MEEFQTHRLDTIIGAVGSLLGMAKEPAEHSGIENLMPKIGSK